MLFYNVMDGSSKSNGIADPSISPNRGSGGSSKSIPGLQPLIEMAPSFPTGNMLRTESMSKLGMD